MIKGEDYSFYQNMRIKSRSYNKNKRSFSINPFALILRESERSFLSLNLFIWNLYLFFDFLFIYFLWFFISIFFPSLFFLFPSIIP